ncbi:protease IV [Bradyrhizobium lablabi]|uniref:protease IV n=1 Tax=Bradyrhizobium lablabi TaxID=722472 RepID=UPI001BA9AB8B|nr:protease IV [Bradyrhizobium lablabi]MBR0695937.1 protease IV [Bradyrhizobium lablabi]
MSWIVAIVVRLAGLAGITLSPFAAGALFAGALAIVIGGAGLAGGLELYNAGYRAADSAWRAKNLQARIDALEVDQDAARRALADARLKVAAIEKQSAEDKQGTADYVEDLKKRFQAACAITDDDLRGLRAQAGADRRATGVAAGAGQSHAAGWRASARKGR